MIKSMTGFGRGNYENDGREYIVEIKTVNHRYSDISIKLPRSISYLEEQIKKVLNQNIKRGKVDVYITFNNYSEKGKEIKINKEIAKKYILELKELAEEAKINDNIEVTEITKFPEVLTIQNNEDEELIWKEIQKPLNNAIEQLLKMREYEGIKISEDLIKRADKISNKINEISKVSTGLVDEYIVKLETRIKELLKTDVIDETRLAQEVVIYSDKTSIQEELTRINSHINQLHELINTNEACGKRLDFLMQELNRETNTIGSKANCLNITNLVIDIKTELEDMREQIQNIE
ncbi:MAG: YicC family protein [Clostridia bacterium]|nr:YicC family protein [Clostridia bacterium]